MGDLIKYGGTNDVKILFFIFSFFNLLTLDYLFLGVCQKNLALNNKNH